MTTNPEPVDRRQLLKDALTRLDEMQNKLNAVERAKNEPIAIVGIGCRFPGGVDSPESYWQLLRDGVDAVHQIPKHRLDSTIYSDSDVPPVWYGGLLDSVDGFDAPFFGISPREASSLDPQQRLTLEVGWEALENAGIAPDKLGGSQTGVFMGISTNDYAQLLKLSGPESLDVYSATGGALNAVPGRLAYTLGLNGPNIAIDTACSSSLVGVHLAAQSLRSGESDLALAGGVNTILMPEAFICFSRWGMMASDGRCKTFDSRADGFVRSEGCGMVVLKRLSDAMADGDRILALVRGSAVNQDGRSSGLTVPNGPAQQAVIRRALTVAKVKPSEISYIETHGTGTLIGDPIEVEAIGTVIGDGRPKDLPLIIGAVKSNIGHAESASGIAGLIKVVLSMQHGEIPRNLHFQEANPRIPWPDFPVIVPTEHMAWTPATGRRLAGVSGFGFSGTNAHVVLEEAPVVEAPPVEERPVHIMTVSAISEPALREMAGKYEQHLARHADVPLVDAAYTALNGRALFSHRLAVVGGSAAEVAQEFGAFARGEESAGAAAGRVEKKARPKIAFLFTGQGAQYVGMGRGLYETQPVFREALDECDAILRPLLKQPLLSVLYPAEGAASPLDETTYTQPALFALEYALAQLWVSWGIQPNAVIGHSVGEYVAAVIAGVFSLEDGLKLIAERGRLMGALPAGGKMAAVFADEATVAGAIADYAEQVSIAAVNGSENIVISGVGEAVDSILEALKATGVKARKLNVSHAFHSPLMEPMLDTFAKTAGKVKFAAPRIRLISNVTGKVAGSEVTQAAYWRKHVREAVRFSDAIETLHEDGYTIYLEVGPSPTLIGMGQRIIGSEGLSWLTSLRTGRDDGAQIVGALGALHVQGVPVDWAAYYGDHKYRKIALPTYPFQRERFWPAVTIASQAKAKPQRGVHPLLGKRLRSPAESIQFEVELGAEWLSYINDHRIYGTAILPGTAYMEIGLAAGKAAFGAGHYAVEELTIHDAMVIPDDAARVVQVFVTAEGAGGGTFKVYSLQDEGDAWKWHAAGKVVASVPDAQAVSLDELQARVQHEMDVEAYYKRFNDIGLNYGAMFHGIQRLWQSPGESLGQVQMPEGILAQVKDYNIHPALLDACLQLIGAAIPDVGEGEAKVYMPLNVGHVEIYKPAPEQAWCHVALRTEDGQAAGQDSYTADLYLMDEGGELVAEINGLFMMRTSPDLLRRAAQQGYEDWLYEISWQMKPLMETGNASAVGRWLIVGGDGEALAKVIESRGGSCDVVDAQNIGDLKPGYSHVVYMVLSTEVALYVVQALAKSQDSVRPQLWVVTWGAQSVGLTAEPVNPDQTELWGFGRVVAIEHPDLWGGLIDLEADSATDWDALLDATLASDGENQVAFRRGQRYVARFSRSTQADVVSQHEALELAITEKGVLDHLTLRPVERHAPAAGEVEVRVRATGMNFRDVLNALGMYPGEVPLGNECAGIVTRVGDSVTGVAVGDEVIALAPGTFRSYVVSPVEWVFPKPSNISFAEAVTLPTTFMTAYYGLHPLAQIKAGDRVLIHAAAGGVGMAAVQIAQRAGAEIFATAGSDEKRDFLKRMGIQHVMNSRTLDFAEEIKAITGGAGVNIALNSLADEFIGATLSIMAEGGVFLELGKLDEWNAEKVAALNPTLHYHRYDLAEVILANPDAILLPFRDLLADVEAGALAPLPLRAFPFTSAGEAFRYMAQARHIGKVVVVQNDVSIKDDATYLVTGGLTGLGLAVAGRLVERGARQIVLIGRRAASIEAQQAIEAMQQGGATVTVMNADVANREQMTEVITAIRESMPPLRGIVHAAGVLDDGLVSQQDWSRFEKVFAPKVQGAWNLHELTHGMALDFFVLFSSGSAVFGAPGQSNYAAANAFMDGLAHYRRVVGLPALSINWGAWTEIGMAAERSVGERVSNQGIGSIPPEDGLRIFEQLIQSEATQVAAMPINWPKFARQFAPGNEPALLVDMIRRTRSAAGEETTSQPTGLAQRLKDAPANERPALALAYVQAQISRVMGIPASRPVDPSQSLSTLGLDSLMAMELKNRVESELKVVVPVSQLLEGPTVERFAEIVLEKMDSAAGAAPRNGSSEKAADNTAELLTNLDELSEAEVDALLNQMLTEKDDNASTTP